MPEKWKVTPLLRNDLRCSDDVDAFQQLFVEVCLRRDRLAV